MKNQVSAPPPKNRRRPSTSNPRPRKFTREQEAVMERMNPRPRKFTREQEAAMERMERCYAKASALMAAAGHLLTTPDYAYGSQVALAISTDLLEEAARLREAGDTAGDIARRIAKP